MTMFSGPPSGATRNKPISAQLRQVLETAARAAGIDAIRITSGGQDALGEGPRRIGSTRHDRGRAADLQCVVEGVTLTFSDQSAHPAIVAFVTAAAKAGATGIGAGVRYMGDKTIHVGFGRSPTDHVQLTWGVDGKPANAPRWLRQAAQAGWTAPPNGIANGAHLAADCRRFGVIARDGLKLRGGPGKEFGAERTLPLGTELNVPGADAGLAWVRVDLEGDGLIDGYVFAAFLALAEVDPGQQDTLEPADAAIA